MPPSEHIRNRIEWKARKQGLPTSYTRFWADCPTALQEASLQIEDPVVFSMTPEGHATIIGSDGILLIRADGNSLIPFEKLCSVGPHSMRSPQEKRELSKLEISDSDGEKHVAYTEKGSPCFAIWNIILMLVRLKKS